MIWFILPLWAQEPIDPILNTAEKEMLRSFEWLQDQDVPPYWMEVAVTDTIERGISASNGAITDRDQYHQRELDLDIRVGDWTVDNTHPIIDGSYFSDDPTHFTGYLPLTNDPTLLSKALWTHIDDAYRIGVRRLIKVQSNRELKVEREDDSADFSKTTPIEYIENLDYEILNLEQWGSVVRQCSAELLNNPDIIFSRVAIKQSTTVRRIVTSEGSKVREVRPHTRLSVHVLGVADDGMNLETYEYIDTRNVQTLSLPICLDLGQTASTTLSQLIEAPVVDPFDGPAILRGKASAVFFHEILGHRVEGHRQKDESEGQTLTDKVGEQIFPNFIQVEDDPTLETFEGNDLNGHYHVDDEAVFSEPVSIVKDGILQGFLMGRSPIEGFPTSNGHGRRQTGYGTVARQGNLVVSSSESKPYPELKQALIAEIKLQEKPFGLIFEDISGGFTFTGRNSPNSYVVKPVTVWRVYPDGREEMVRGVDMIGTPLITFSRILAASNNPQIFNGMCGAESGWVPVSAVAPDLLVKEVEIQRRAKDHDKPPLLPAPTLQELP